MKRTFVFVTGALAAFVALAGAQAQSQQSLATSFGVFVAPAKGQTAEQQAKDESECYNTAKQTVGTDPQQLAQQRQQQQQQTQQAQQQVAEAGKGAAAKGAVAGAATGAVVV